MKIRITKDTIMAEVGDILYYSDNMKEYETFMIILIPTQEMELNEPDSYGLLDLKKGIVAIQRYSTAGILPLLEEFEISMNQRGLKLKEIYKEEKVELQLKGGI